MSKDLRQLIEEHPSLSALLQTAESIIWEADAQTFAFSYVSDKVKDILGYSAEEWLNTPNFWQEHIYQEDRDDAVNLCHNATQKLRDHALDYRMVAADGHLVWIKDFVSVVGKEGKPSKLYGIMVDITVPKIRAELDHLEKEVLELAATQGNDLENILNTYLNGVEQLFPNMHCSIVKINDNKMHHWVAPSLPQDYTSAINNIPIGPSAGSCGTAAHRQEMVIVNDIATDELWAAHKHLCLPYDLKACWSMPVIGNNGTVHAVLGTYYNTTKEPDSKELKIIQRIAAILKVILDNRAYARTVEENNMLLQQSQSLANFGSWQWDVQSNRVTWSDELYNIYGIDKNTFEATFEGYQKLLHPDDKDYIVATVTNALNTGEDATFEERIIRPNGEVRYLNSWSKVIKDDNGQPVKMFGACLDITKDKQVQQKMQEIAWQQSHMVRAPLASLMGLTNLLKEETFDNKEQQKLLEHILQTAKQLDDVIRTISRHTNH